MILTGQNKRNNNLQSLKKKWKWKRKGVHSNTAATFMKLIKKEINSNARFINNLSMLQQ
jgi:hypothetical protein